MTKVTKDLIWATVLIAIAAVVFFATTAHAHTMNESECHTYAWDAKQEAFDRAQATFKMQMAVMAASLEVCHDAAHKLTCIYKDDADVEQAINTLNWVYDNAKMTPQQIHDKVQSDCNERLMDSLRQDHGVK